MTTVNELQEKRSVLRGLLFDVEEWRTSLSDEAAAVERAQLAGDRSLATVEHARYLGGQLVESQRRRLNVSRQLADVQEQINREAVTV